MAIKKSKFTEENMQKLFYKEDWKTLVEGIKYRRVGTDVEINISTTQETTFSSFEMKKMRNFR